MRAFLFPLVFVCLLASLPAYAQKVHEAESTASINGDKALVRLIVESDGDLRSVAARAELIDTTDKVVATQSRSSVALQTGKQAIEFSLPLVRPMQDSNDDIAWYRLRYSVANSSGTISLSQMITDLFELRVVAADNLFAGMIYRARVAAVNPFTRRPISGVNLESVLEIELKGDDDSVLKLNAAAMTDAEGAANLEFDIPVGAELSSDGEITVTGRKNGVIRVAEDDLNPLDSDIQVLTMADKPIYQPGQILNLRAILLKGVESRTVLASADVEFRVEDEDETLLYREKVAASQYGIVALAWRIPSAAKLGEYRITIKDSAGETIGVHQVKVSRYDLPNFSVTAKPSKNYYLPSDKEAEIEIRADYLFGKPVTKGKVRVVEEKNREWDWKQQKYEVDEGEVREGETDAGGKFIARFSLEGEHEDLEDDSDKYEDMKFAAYFTDASTNKTEQRRFDIRVTREPIHVYLINGRNGEHPSLPMTLYISTFYADGTPAACDVEIRASVEDEDKFKTVARTRTNSFGAGKISMPKPSIGDPDDDLEFGVIAKDKSGRRGTESDEVSFDDSQNALRFTTSKSIYKPGEAIDMKIQSTVKTGTVHVDIVSGWSVIDARAVKLNGGNAELRIPYNDHFKGELKLAAYIEDPEDDDDLITSVHGVLFPAKQGIKVDATFDKAIYKPNEEATVTFGILDVVGAAVESALGVVVFDKAVEERARTDADFGGMFRGLSGWLGYGKGFGGVNIKDLNELDVTRPISEEMQLVGEIVLHDSYYHPGMFRSQRYYAEAKSVFGESVSKQFTRIDAVLKHAFEKQNYLYPVEDAGLRRILAAAEIDFDAMRDPWGVGYNAEFATEKSRHILTIMSAGPDKTFKTDDDFTAFTTGFEYFTPLGRAIDTVVNNYHRRTSEFIRDEKTLLSELGMTKMVDRFGRPYQISFGGEGRILQLRVRSGGPDGKFEKYDWAGDDFYVWANAVDFFAPLEQKILGSQRDLKNVPMTEAAFRETLKEKGIDFDQIRDGAGNPLFISVLQRSRFWDKVTVQTVQNFGDARRSERSVVTPVTQEVIEFDIRSNGRDGKKGTWDDVTLSKIVHVLSEQSRDDVKPVQVTRPISYRNANTGSIAGTVTDPNGAFVPNASITATNTATSRTRSTTSDDEGKYLIANLESGIYSINVAAEAGFSAYLVENISVKAGATVTVDISLHIAGANTTVDVTAATDTIETTNSSVSTTVTSTQIENLPINTRNAMQLVGSRQVKVITKSGDSNDPANEQQTSTPRLREYFPETLYWQPEIVTGSDGRAEVKFRMADNITTWKMYTIASTKNGKIGFAEKEVAAFQSFFVDLDPPKFLTTGDEIFLPTQVRNYTDKKQNVKVTMAAADWFGFLAAETQQIAVGSGESENAVFGFKAIAPTKEGKQRVTALAEDDSDAIERPVTVRPDGREIVRTESRYITGGAKFDVDFPANALSGTSAAELKIYPNLMAHVAESVEGLLRRPYGCGEQTISSTYPNLMILKFATQGERKPTRISEPVERKARKFLQSGYERLLGYQVADGGFSYWGGKDAADFALTAYALRFLADASAFIAVDPDVVKRAEDWLVKQQRTDGSWNKKYDWEKTEDIKRAVSTTTYVTRTLAMVRAMRRVTEPGAKSSEIETAVGKALKYLSTRNNEIDDPYSLALLGLAALDGGDDARARNSAQRLTTLAKDEAGAAYWNLEANTVFNGWGSAGRIETTALVTQLLTRLNIERDLCGRAILFLLKNKDRYGVWYSTQTTVNVLDAFVVTLAATDHGRAQTVEIVLNGQPIRMVEITPDKLDQITVDLTGKLTGEKNTVELRTSDRTPIMAQVVANHYLDWKDAEAPGRTVDESRALRLDYRCDRASSAIMEEVSCAVEAERIGYRGYGMLLAEIGTPPGADVSRESLQAAMDADWSISRYDILPDRIVVYMWSKAGGTKFNFKFRPRYAINAKTPASTVYDYYNPEAQATVSPLRFAVK